MRMTHMSQACGEATGEAGGGILIALVGSWLASRGDRGQ